MCGLLLRSFQRNSYSEVQLEQWCFSKGIVKLWGFVFGFFFFSNALAMLNL